MNEMTVDERSVLIQEIQADQQHIEAEERDMF